MKASALLLLTMVVPGWAQNFEQRGFIENDALFFPQTAPNDRGHVVDEVLLRWEGSYQVEPWLKFSTAIDARADSHREVERKLRLDLDDRGLQRPAFSLRRMSATIHKRWFTAELGRQFIRWGKADILNPTDRFAPKDYLTSVVNGDFLGVTAARVTLEAGSSNTVDLVWQPWFTPSRTPLLDQRWTAVPQQLQGYSILDAGAHYPGGSQYGARWNHIGSGYEYSLMFFDGFNNLPTFNGTFAADTIILQRTYPRLRMYGADGAVPLPWVTLKGEAAYYTSPDHNNDEFILYVVQLERQVKEWSLVGGYAGEQVTRSENPFEYSPERGFARSFVGHAGWTIDANRSLILETAVRGGGSFVRAEYSQATGQHWNTTAGATWLRGDMADFLGQYRRNSYLTLKVRYSF